jgi:putative FmdB family regulatory protein
MPMYTYRCQSCGAKSKETQTFIAAPLKRCPECQRDMLRRVLQLPTIVFKGAGWYSTDHRSHAPAGQTNTLRPKTGKVKHPASKTSGN